MPSFKHLLDVEVAVWARLEAVVGCLGELLSIVTSRLAVDHTMKCLQHMYRVLAAAAKHTTAPRGTSF